MYGGANSQQLPSAVRGTPVHTWQIDIEVNILYYAIDPAQDLAVLVGWPVTHDEQRHTFGIHLRTMSTRAYHPCASDPVLACAVAPKIILVILFFGGKLVNFSFMLRPKGGRFRFVDAMIDRECVVLLGWGDSMS
ncbi:hypothetical protein JB92DRAFT_2829582 [Gautieria morchelliformis]|nr:hypothetical protein JB92DRAFT_2829582 [Gautieria morchelliformis]